MGIDHCSRARGAAGQAAQTARAKEEPMTDKINLSQLHVVPDEQNPNRMSPEEYVSLLAGMRAAAAGGDTDILQPILVAPRGGVGWWHDGSDDGHDDCVPDTVCVHAEFDVVDGAHRTKAARELGWGTIDAVVRVMTPEEVLAYRVGMNRNRGRIDLAAAALIVQDLTLKGWSAEELVITGFSAGELSDLAASHHATDADLMADAASATVEDDAPAANPRPFVLELTFPTSKELARVKRLLRKAAGKGNSMEHGLVTVLEGKS